MKWKTLAIVLIVFSVLYWFDYFVSFMGTEINPLYSPQMKVLMFPVLIGSVLGLNKLWGSHTATKFAPIFLVSLFTFAFVWNLPTAFGQASDFNGDFEDVLEPNFVADYCKYGTFSCGSSIISDNPNQIGVEVPTGWNIQAFNSTHVIDTGAFHLVADTGYVRSGIHAMTIWYQPPSADHNNQCAWIQQTGKCGNTSVGLAGILTSPLIEVNSSDVELRFEYSVPNQYPIRDGNKFYGETCSDGQADLTEAQCELDASRTANRIDGSFKVVMEVQGVSGNITLWSGLIDLAKPSEAEFKTGKVDLEPFLTTVPNNITIKFQIEPSSFTTTFPTAITIDNVQISQKVVTPSPATTYINDMTTFSSFPLDNTTFSCAPSSACPSKTFSLTTGFNPSTRFDGVAIGLANVTFNTNFLANQQTGSLTQFDINYLDGTTVSVLSEAEQEFKINLGSATGHQIAYYFPIFDFDNVKNITWSANNDFLSGGGGDIVQTFSLTYDDRFSEIRQFYGSSIFNDRESLTGASSLWKVVQYDNVVLSNKTHVFKLFNFGNSENLDLEFELRDSSGSLKDVASGTFFAGKRSFSTHSDNWLTDQTIAVGDRITIIYNTSTKFTNDLNATVLFSNTSTNFSPSQVDPISSCQSYCGLPDGTVCFAIGDSENRDCDGTTQFTAVPISNPIGSDSCSFFPISSSQTNQCEIELAVVVVDEDDQPFAVNSTTPIFDLQEPLNQSGVGFLGVFLTPLSIMFFIMLGISVYIEMKVTTGGVAFLGTLISGVLLMTFFGIFPVSVAVLIIIIAGMLLVVQARKLIGGGM